MTKGTELASFITLLNGGATIDDDLLTVLVQTAQTVLEAERPWMVLRKTDTSLSLTTAKTWQDSVGIDGIADSDFASFYSEFPIRLFDGSNRIQDYRQVPFDRRLDYKDAANTFVFDENQGNLYFNGIAPFNGSLYLSYVSFSTPVDPTSAEAVWTVFPSRFLPLLGFYAIGIHKGAVDYDSINKLMLPTNAATLQALKNAMEKWDNDRQASAIATNDPTDLYAYPRSGAIDPNA